MDRISELIPQPIIDAGEALVGGLDTLRALYESGAVGFRSVAGFVEASRRAAAGDLHPAALWSIYAAEKPEEVVLVQGERRFTWAEANCRINRLGNALHTVGVEPGERVAIMLHNSIEWFEAMAACQKIGASAVFVSYRYTAPEVRYLLENSGARALIFGVEHADVVREASATVDLGGDRAVAGGAAP